jgi:hypothetical protein
MSRPAIPSQGGNDVVMTPYPLALAIVRHFAPMGNLLEPCCGSGAFLRAMRAFRRATGPRITGIEWREISKGRDFLIWHDPRRFDWIITNPPWSLFAQFLNRAMMDAHNVVFLCHVNAWFTTRRVRDVAAAGYGMFEIAYVDRPKEWPSMGLQLAAVHIRRGWDGPCKIGQLSS